MGCTVHRRASRLGAWTVLALSAAGLVIALWNTGRFDLDIYLDAVRSWPEQSLYDYRDPRVGLPFNYPPFAAVLLLPLSTLDREIVDKLWLVAGVAGSAVFLVCVARLAPRLPFGRPAGVPLVAAVGLWTVPVLHTARLGQINWLLALLVITDVVLERRRPKWAGYATGVATAVKVFPAAAVLFFMAGGNWAAVRRFAVAAVSLSLAAGVVMPEEFFSYWTDQVFTIDRLFGADNPLSTSIRREIAWLPIAEPVATLLWLGAAGTLGWIALRRIAAAAVRRNPLAGMTIAMCAGSACFPLSWSHHLYFLPAAAVLWFGDGRKASRRLGGLALAVLLFEGLRPGRNPVLIVARAVALVAVTVALPIDDASSEEAGNRQPAVTVQ